MSDANNDGSSPGDTRAYSTEEMERRIEAVLRADEEAALQASEPRTPQSEEESRFLDEARALVAGPLAPSGRHLVAPSGRTALVRRRRSGAAARGQDRFSVLRIGAVAATVVMVGGAAFFALRAGDPGPDEGMTGETPGRAAEGGRTYMGPDSLGPAQEGLRSAAAEPLPAIVDWSNDVQEYGPFIVRVSHTGHVRLDETPELEAFETMTSDPQWSCPTNRYDLLPETFWVEVYLRNDPHGADPVWRRKFSRP